ncbi:MAG: NAD(P)-dependent oxidoreductase [Syntrophorhabdus sp.]|jgi:3-hydroxyisobutyrate dehydrogenase|nr:NAD(P)-dependent oxidoreductase [Syntrophorhabdus sp.]
MKKAGFIGLGHLGGAMARRLISEGIDLVVWNRTVQKAKDLGVEVAASPAGVADRADIIFLNLFDSAAVREVLTGSGGLLEGDVAGKLIVDTTTNHFFDVLAFHDACSGKDCDYIEAPVLGSVIPASQGNLVILVSGEVGAFERAEPYLRRLGRNIFFLGEKALANRMKLVNNLVLGTFMAVIAEATVLGERSGIQKETVLDILSAGAGNSGVMNAKKERILNEDFTTHFSAALIYKDLHYLQDLARTLRVPLFTGAMTKEIFALTFRENKEPLDMSVVYEVIRAGHG